MNGKKIKTYIPRVALFVTTFIPLTEGHGWISYANYILCGILFLISFGIIFHDGWRSLLDTRTDHYFDIAISVLGLAISYSVGNDELTGFWWFVGISALLNLLLPENLKRTRETH